MYGPFVSAGFCHPLYLTPNSRVCLFIHFFPLPTPTIHLCLPLWNSFSQLSKCPHFHSPYSLGRAPRSRLPYWWPWSKTKALHSVRRRQAWEGPHGGNVQMARKGFTWRDKRRCKIITCLRSLLAVSSFLCKFQRDWVSFTPSPAPA